MHRNEIDQTMNTNQKLHALDITLVAVTGIFFGITTMLVVGAIVLTLTMIALHKKE